MARAIRRAGHRDSAWPRDFLDDGVISCRGAKARSIIRTRCRCAPLHRRRNCKTADVPRDPVSSAANPSFARSNRPLFRRGSTRPHPCLDPDRGGGCLTIRRSYVRAGCVDFSLLDAVMARYGRTLFDNEPRSRDGFTVPGRRWHIRRDSPSARRARIDPSSSPTAPVASVAQRLGPQRR